MQKKMSWVNRVWIIATASLTFLAPTSSILATGAMECPFCGTAKQTMRQDIESMDVIAIGELVAGPTSAKEIDGFANFQIKSIVKGQDVVSLGQTVEIIYFGPAKSERKFLLMGTDPTQITWSSPMALSADGVNYIDKLTSIPEDPVERLKFYQGYLEHEDSLLARDAYDEFAVAPYEDVKSLKPHMEREKLVKWVQDPNVSPERKRLYFTLLGICGLKEDAKMVEKLITDDSVESKAGMDATIACYLTLSGDEGLPLIEERFLKNKKSQYPATYAAVSALRFHATEGGVLTRDKVLHALHTVLDRPVVADLVIPDLARLKDWSQIDKMVELFKTADEDSSWVRVPIVNYLRTCPLPSAAEKIIELEAIDPKTVQRAKTLYPVVAPPAEKDSSSIQSKQVNTIAQGPMLDVEGDPRSFPMMNILTSEQISLAQVEQGTWVSKQPVVGEALNRTTLGFVGILASLTLVLTMWFLISGSGLRKPAAVLVRSNSHSNNS